MLRYWTAGESHGEAIIGLIEGIPAHVTVTSGQVSAELARRRLGAGRGARMKFEADKVRLLTGIRHGKTLGSPIAIEIGNTEWPKWKDVMAPDPVDPTTIENLARNAALTRPRPGHADLAGMQKYDFAEARPILERASARETAARVAIGLVAKNFLAQAYGITVLSHVVELGSIKSSLQTIPSMADLPSVDASPVRCLDKEAEKQMLAEIQDCHSQGDTLGGVVEIVAWNTPPGLGSHTQPDRKLDAKLAGSLMGIQAIKGVEIGDGFNLAKVRGSNAHDEIFPGMDGVVRRTNHSGGIEGGMSTGDVIRVRVAMKPIATVPKPLATLDVATGEPALAHHQRSDVCAVPAVGVIGESVVALVLAQLCLEKFGGDSLNETQRNYYSYLNQLKNRGLGVSVDEKEN